MGMTSIAVSALGAGGQAAPRMELSPATARFEEEFTQVAAVRELADSRLIVADPRERRLVILDPRDGSVRPIARTGNGPGEFQFLQRLVPLQADSTLVTDAQNRRWLVLAGDKVVETIAPDQPLPEQLGPELAGADASGRVIAPHLDPEVVVRRLRESRAGTPSTGVDSLVLRRGYRGTGVVDTVAKLRSRSRRVNVVERRSGRGPTAFIFENPLEADEQALLFADGWIALARVNSFRVDWRRPDGSVLRGQAIPSPIVRVDDREKQYAFSRRYSFPGQAPFTLDDVPAWPETLPPFLAHALLASPDGRVVVARTQGAAVPGPRYDVVDRRGVVTGQLVLKPNERLVGFGVRSVCVVERDPDDIERIRRHPWP